MQGGDVKALDAHGRAGQGKRAFKLQERRVDALFVVARAHLVAHERVLGVELRHLQQIVLLSAQGHRNGHFGAMLAGKAAREPRLDACGVLVVKLLGDDDLVGDSLGLVVVAVEKLHRQLVVRDVHALVQDEVAAVDDAAFTDHKDMSRRYRLFAVKTHHVHREAAAEHGLLLLLQRVDGAQTIAHTGRTLKVEVCRRLMHLVF